MKLQTAAAAQLTSLSILVLRFNDPVSASSKCSTERALATVSLPLWNTSPVQYGTIVVTSWSS